MVSSISMVLVALRHAGRDSAPTALPPHLKFVALRYPTDATLHRSIVLEVVDSRRACSIEFKVQWRLTAIKGRKGSPRFACNVPDRFVELANEAAAIARRTTFQESLVRNCLGRSRALRLRSQRVAPNVCAPQASRTWQFASKTRVEPAR